MDAGPGFDTFVLLPSLLLPAVALDLDRPLERDTLGIAGPTPQIVGHIYRLHRQSTEHRHCMRLKRFGMPLPPSLASFAKFTSLLTAVRSGWKLSRLVRKKLKEQAALEKANLLFQKLCDVYEENKISEDDYNFWKRRIMIATEKKNCMVKHLTTS